jgi:hypothetical protein
VGIVYLYHGQGDSIMADQSLLDVLYNELIHLDEEAGCFDEETNAAIDRQRQKLYNQIRELEAA